MKNTCVIIMILFIVSCSEKPKINSNLLGFNREFIMENGIETEPYFKDKKKFLKKYLKITSINDTLFISTVKHVNTCEKFIGDITISNDTIKLLTIPVGGETCTSESLYRCDYKLLIAKDKNYKIFDNDLLLGTSQGK